MKSLKTRWWLVGLVLLALAAVAYTFVQGGRWESYITAGREAFQRANYAEAEKQFAAAFKEAEGFGPEDPRLAKSLNNLAEVYSAQGRYANAEPLFKRALAIYEKALGPEHPNVATGLNNLALLYNAQGRYAEAEPTRSAPASSRDQCRQRNRQQRCGHSGRCRAARKPPLCRR